MTTIIRAGSPAEFLSLVPHLAGYLPQRSVVLVPFRGSRTAGLLRFDLPRGDPDAFASSAVGTVCRMPGVDGVAVVVYTDEPTRERLPHLELAACLHERADACGLRLGEALVVGADGWASYADGERHSLDDLPDAHVADLPPLAGHQAEGTDLPRVAPEHRRAVRAAVRTIERALGAVASDPVGAADPRTVDAAEAFDDPTLLWDDALGCDPAELEPHRSALLLWTLRRPVLRDVALACWAHGPAYADGILEFQLSWRSGDPPPDEPLFLAGEGPRPDADRLAQALTLVRRLAALGGGEHRAAALGCAAWLSWALGLGTHADAYARRALKADPALGLAEIVLTVSNAGHLPAWAFDTRAGN